MQPTMLSSRSLISSWASVPHMNFSLGRQRSVSWSCTFPPLKLSNSKETQNFATCLWILEQGLPEKMHIVFWMLVQIRMCLSLRACDMTLHAIRICLVTWTLLGDDLCWQYSYTKCIGQWRPGCISHTKEIGHWMARMSPEKSVLGVKIQVNGCVIG